jgi:sulfonate transport system substrate-binding protein
MAQIELEEGARLFFRDAGLNSYGFLNVREDFAAAHPSLVERVLIVYETARKWSLAHPAELRAIVAKAAKLSEQVAAKQLERNDLSSGMIGDRQRQAIIAAGDVLKEAGVIPAQTDIGKTADALVDPQYITLAGCGKTEFGW